jgi:hypothetical protein
MTPSIYVIQKSTGTLYCVTKQHYEEYKDWYTLQGQEKEPEVIEKPEEPVVAKDPLGGFDVSATLTPTKRPGRIKKEK